MPERAILLRGVILPMRQFVTIVAAAYVIVGVGTGLVFYDERHKPARSDSRQGDLVVESVVAGLFWPFHINAVLSRHDARKLS